MPPLSYEICAKCNKQATTERLGGIIYVSVAALRRPFGRLSADKCKLRRAHEWSRVQHVAESVARRAVVWRCSRDCGAGFRSRRTHRTGNVLEGRCSDLPGKVPGVPP